ncbi:hypothetical protein GGU11DRAFT_514916 [Lentinula aff. detonsa]|nr:hypothetical protein GGU11DRAFT_514916 [Lentinula aff. detonsa]
MSPSSSSKSESSTSRSEKCRIAEIIQYTCELEQSQTEGHVIRCFPLSRLFKICPGRPGIELTKVLNVDEGGVVELPDNIKQPIGKLWHEVIRHGSSSNT